MKRTDVVEQAEKTRADMNTVTANLSDAEAILVANLYLPWKVPETVPVGEIRRFGDKLYRCLQEHTTQAGWTPDVTPALWVEVAAEGEYREIKDNMLPTEAFVLGEVGWYKTKDDLYESLIDNNVYTPETYPSGWKKYTE